MIAIPPLPRPGPRYAETDETQFRRTLELMLRQLAAAQTPILTVPVIADSGGNSVVTAVPAARTEWQGSTRWRTRVNLRDYQTVELTLMVVNAGSAGAQGGLDYTADLTGASGWTALDPVVSLGSTGVKQSLTNLPAGARNDVLIRPVTVNGDGATNAAVGLTRVVFR